MADEHPNLLVQHITRAGQLVSRYGLVVVLAWIGFGKYVKMESRVLIEHSPLMSWIYDVFSVTTVARGLGTMEIVAALLIAVASDLAARVRGRQCAGGTCSSSARSASCSPRPGWSGPTPAGLPVLTALPGQFLLKDLVLIGVALWTLGDSLTAASAATHAAQTVIP